MPKTKRIAPILPIVNYDPGKPPKDLMGARKCLMCGRNWPNRPMFSPSPCCNEEAGITTNEQPDMNWFDACKELRQAKFERWYMRRDDDHIET